MLKTHKYTPRYTLTQHSHPRGPDPGQSHQGVALKSISYESHCARLLECNSEWNWDCPLSQSCHQDTPKVAPGRWLQLPVALAVCPWRQDPCGVHTKIQRAISVVWPDLCPQESQSRKWKKERVLYQIRVKLFPENTADSKQNNILHFKMSKPT